MPAGDVSASSTIELALRLRYHHGFGALEPWFDGLRRGVAMAIRCRSCGEAWCPPRLPCPCGGREVDWIALNGTGTVIAATHGPGVLPLRAERGELAFGLVALDGAGNRMFARLASVAIAPGDRVCLSRVDGDAPHPAQSAWFTPAPPAP